MARSRRPVRKRRDKNLDTPIREEQEFADSSRPRRNWARFLFVATVLMVAFIYFLPTIIAVTPLKQLAINQALSKFRGRVQIQNASLGWFSPVRLTGVDARDEMGQPLFQVATLSTKKSLLALISGRDLGQINIVEPTLYVKLRQDGSNIEDAIANYLVPSSAESEMVPCRVNIAGGNVALSSDQQHRVWSIQQLNANLEVMQGELPLSATVSGSVAALDVPPGQFQAEAILDEGCDRLTAEDVKVELSARRLPTEIFAPVLSRLLLEPIELGGLLDGKISAHWSGSEGTFVSKASPATIHQFRLAAAKRLGVDVIQLENLKLQGDLALTSSSISANQFACVTDVGQLNANGSMSWTQISELASGGQLPEAEFHSSGELDIAKLAAMMPQTIPLQEDLQIDDGTLQFMVSSRIEGEARRLLVNIESNGLTAIRHGQTINWDKPIRVVSVLRQTPDSMIVESLDCTTNFLQIAGSASREQGKFTAKGDLEAAVAELHQIFDLGGFRLAGKIDGEFAWKFDGDRNSDLANRPVRLGGRFHVERPMLKWPNQPRWRRPQLDLTFQAAGQRETKNNNHQEIHIDTGHLELQSGQEKLVADLAQPLVNPSFASPLRVKCQIAGDVGNWLAQIKTFVPIDFACDGQINASAMVVANRQSLRIEQSECEIENLEFDGYGVSIREPKVVADLQVICDLAKGTIRLPAMTLASSAVSARGQQLVFDPAEGQNVVRGNVAFRADVNRFLAWFAGPQTGDSINWFGDAQGTVRLDTDTDSIGGQFNATIHDLIAARETRPQPGTKTVAHRTNWTRLFEEKQLKFQSNVKLSRSFDQLVINSLALNSSAANIKASGSFSDLFGLFVADIQGTWNPDWQRLESLAQGYMGELVTLQGVKGQRFEIKGPMINSYSGEPGASTIHPDLQAATTVSWERGTLLGLPIGHSKINAKLNRGIATADPMQIPFSGGTINLSPLVDLNGPSPVLEISQGKIVDQVQITPQICRGWLMFVAPVIADATAAQGTFSLTNSGIRMPLDRPQAVDFGGALLLHGASVGPGPLGQQLMSLVAQVKSLAKGVPPVPGSFSAPTQTTWMTMPEQSIPFAVKQQRVYHNGMKFQIDDVTIETQGSVGFDKSIQMVARIPIQDSWLGDHRWVAGLKGQTLEIPINGNVASPQVDGSRLQNIAQQMITGAANNAIQNELNNLMQQGNQKLGNELFKGLNKLLVPKK